MFPWNKKEYLLMEAGLGAPAFKKVTEKRVQDLTPEPRAFPKIENLQGNLDYHQRDQKEINQATIAYQQGILYVIVRK